MRRLAVPVLLVLGLLLLVVAVPAVADDEPSGPGPFPYFFVVRSTVHDGQMDAYRGAISVLVAAHEQHEDGNVWATFTPITGGADPVFYYFVPMQEMGDVDGWVPNARIVAETLGEEEAGRVLTELAASSASTNMVLAYDRELSNPGRQDGRPPAHLWAFRVRVDPVAMAEYRELSGKMKAAHAGHEHGVHWVTYHSMIGGSPGELYFFAGFERFAELDDWPFSGGVLAEAYGAEEAARINTRVAAISEASSAIWSFVPPMSRAPGPPMDEEDEEEDDEDEG